MNILEQEDQLKGMPDSMLLMEMEQPSGMYPPFLVASEQQRRNTMRENYAASEEQPTMTVVEQEYQKGLASAMPPSSPAPVAPNSLPSSFPVDGYSQGSMGAGDLVMANTGGQFPDLSGDGKVTRKDILMGRGVVTMDAGRQTPPSGRNHTIGRMILESRGEDWRNYQDDYVESLGREQTEQYYALPEDSGLGALVQRPRAETISLEELRENQISAPDMINRYSLASEYEQPFGGPGAEEPPTKFESFIEDIRNRVQDSPTQQISEYEKSLMKPSVLRALEAREGAKAGIDILGDATDYGLEELSGVLDFGTVLATGDPDDPSGQRAEAMEGLVEGGDNFFTGYLPRKYRSLMYTGEDSPPLDEQFMSKTGDIIDAIGGVAGDVTSRGGILFDELVSGRSDLEMKDLPLIGGFFDDEDAPVVREEGDIRSKPSVKKDVARAGFPTPGQETVMQDILAGGPQKRDFAGGNMITDSLVRNAMREGIDEGLGIGEESMINMEDAYGQFDTAQAEQTANLRDLIGRTRQEAKDRAFYMGIAALGAGIAKGDMAGGMDKAVEIASDITARGEASIAPLEAAAATQPAQAAKDRIDALAAIARADATFQNVRAQLVREGGLDRRSYNQLRGYALRAAQQAVENLEYAEGLDTPQAVAKAINQIADQMMGEYAPLMQPTGSDLFIPNADGSFRYVGEMPQ